MTRFAIALGSNLGDRQHHLRSGLEELRKWAVVGAVSGLYETAPIGGPDQDPYLNAVVVVESDLNPGQVLRRLQEIEARHGRERLERWGPRTLDLDIVTSDGPRTDQPDLVIPHPRAAERRFVVEPLIDVWPDAEIEEGIKARDLLESVSHQEVALLSRNWSRDPGTKIGRRWVSGQLLLFATFGLAVVFGGNLPSGGWGPFEIAGIVVSVVGLGLIAASASSLGSGLTALPEPLSGAALVEKGPYRWMRHPMYSGVIVLFAGMALFSRSLPASIVVAVLIIYFLMKSAYEEKQLRISYPGYGRYRKRVPYRLAPPFF